MTKKLSTLTIGIPAYNEAENIGLLLADLKVQNQRGFVIAKILVVSDASTDQTDNIVKKIEGLPLSLLTHPVRRGLATSLNYIFRHSSSDVLITLDADIRLPSKNFLSNLIDPIIAGQADYTTSSIKESIPRSFFAKCLAVSMQVKRSVYDQILLGHNLYNSFGLARSYSRRMYRSLKFPISVGNDMYSYLFTLSHGYNFLHVKKAKVLYYLPTTLTDSNRQSLRFFQARKYMEQYFDRRLVDSSIRIPLTAIIKGLWISLPLLAKHPLHAIAYAGYLSLTAFTSLHFKIEDRWEIATTTKHE